MSKDINTCIEYSDLTQVLNVMKSLDSLLCLQGHYLCSTSRHLVGMLALDLGYVAWQINCKLKDRIYEESNKEVK